MDIKASGSNLRTYWINIEQDFAGEKGYKGDESNFIHPFFSPTSHEIFISINLHRGEKVMDKIE